MSEGDKKSGTVPWGLKKLAAGGAKAITGDKLHSFSLGYRNKTPFQRQKEAQEEKKRQAELEAAQVYAEFVESFNDEGKPQGMNFVSGGVEGGDKPKAGPLGELLGQNSYPAAEINRARQRDERRPARRDDRSSRGGDDRRDRDDRGPPPPTAQDSSRPGGRYLPPPMSSFNKPTDARDERRDDRDRPPDRGPITGGRPRFVPPPTQGQRPPDDATTMKIQRPGASFVVFSLPASRGCVLERRNARGPRRRSWEGSLKKRLARDPSDATPPIRSSPRRSPSACAEKSCQNIGGSTSADGKRIDSFLEEIKARQEAGLGGAGGKWDEMPNRAPLLLLSRSMPTANTEDAWPFWSYLEMRPPRDLSNASLRSDLALGVRRRHAPKIC